MTESDDRPTSARPLTLRARTPDDLLAIVPCVLGFHPEHSLVMLTFGAPGQGFHARVDLPDDPDHVPLVTESLLHAATRNRVSRVVLVAYTPDPVLAERAVLDLLEGLTIAGIDVAETLRADGRLWFPVLEGHPVERYAGVPYDPSSHPFLAQSILEGRVTHSSRGELAATLVGSDPDALDAVEEAVDRAVDRLADLQRPAEALWIRETVRRHVFERRPLCADDAGRLLLDVLAVDLRDVAWAEMSRETAAAHVDFWRDLVRRTPPELMAAPATLLAFAAWLAGQGALAWCALDRCFEVDPDYSLADLIVRMLEGAVPPSTWSPITEANLPALRPGNGRNDPPDPDAAA